MLLIVSNESDVTSDYVVLELQKRGHSYFRLNTERLPLFECTWHLGVVPSDLEIRTSSQSFKLSGITAAYFRRPGRPIIPENTLDDTASEYCLKEWTALLRSIYSAIGLRWLNSPTAIAAAEDKPLQLREAVQIGFQIPVTMLSNSPTAARRFVAERQAIAKPLSTALLDEGGDERVIFTNRLVGALETECGSIEAAPIIFQEEIGKSFDVRATVVGDRVFSALIDSQQLSETQVDWRQGENPDIPHFAHELPKDVSQKCVALTQSLGLRFGAIDLVLDRSGAYWFLEINPNGQWAWIESRLGLPISSAIVDEMEVISRQ